MYNPVEDNLIKTNSNNTQISKNQCLPFCSLSTNQLLTSLYITPDGEIFVGTKYWFSIYYFYETELKAKKHISIGSKINYIDSKIFSNSDRFRYIALATSDGFVNFLKVEFDDDGQLSLDTHERISIFYGETKFVSIIDENTIVSAGDDNIISVISKENTWKHNQYKRNCTITALKYFSDQIFVGYENGEVDIFKSPQIDSTKQIPSDLVPQNIIKFESAILGFYYSQFLIVVTDRIYHELDQKELKESNQFSFPFKADKISIAFDQIDDKTIQQMLISDSNQIKIYENNQLASTLNISTDEHSSMSFLGDALVVASSNTISLYLIKHA